MVAVSRQVQMNTRIEASLKEAGDSVLGRLGYTPSAAVRGLWRFAVEHADDAAAIRRVVEPEAAEALDDETSRRLAACASLRGLYEQTTRALGISGRSAEELPSWDSLRDAWYDERLGQVG